LIEASGLKFALQLLVGAARNESIHRVIRIRFAGKKARGLLGLVLVVKNGTLVFVQQGASRVLRRLDGADDRGDNVARALMFT